MALSPPAEEQLSAGVERVAPVAVPAGLAVVTWLTLLLAAGVLVRFEGSLLATVVPLFFVALLAWPVYRAAPWRAGVTDRTRRWLDREWPVLAVVAGLAVLPILPLVPDPVVSVLQLPYRGSGLFFGATVFYREQLGPLAGRLLLRFGQWTIQLLWLYLLATLVVGAVGRVR